MTNTSSRVETVLREYGGLESGFSFHNETDLRADLHFDSLDLISVAMQIEDEFRIEITDDDVDSPALGTFGGLVAHVDGKLMAREAKFRDFKDRTTGLSNGTAGVAAV